MQITFLIGNGFDVAFGLKTKYEDFYGWYKDQESSNKHIDEFKNNITNCILKEKEENKEESIDWSDFEIGFGQYSKKFKEGEEEQYLECYEDAKEQLMEYLEKEETKIPDILDKVDCEKIWQGVRTFYTNLSERKQRDLSSLFDDLKQNSHTVKFISFNYTDALDQLIHKIKEERSKVTYGTLRPWTVPSNVYHIHGTKNEYPIIGLSDESQIANEQFRENEEILDTLIKSKSIDAIEKNWYIDTEREIQHSSIICVYGMSLGESDRLWWKFILDWLFENNARHLFLFMYDSEELSTLSTRAYRKYRKEMKESILKFATAMDTSLISDRIHIIRNTKTLFYFDNMTK